MANDSVAPTHRELADKFVAAENYFEASKEYERAANVDSADASLWSSWADALYHRRKYVEAAEKYLKSVELAPDSADYDGWAKAYGKLTKDEQARKSQEFDQAVSGGPQAALAYTKWGDTLSGQGESYAEASEKYRQAIRVKPDEARAYAGLGKALCRQEQYAQAIEPFLKAAEIDPKSMDFNQWVSALRALPQSPQKAAADRFQRIVDGKPAEADAWLGWGGALASKESYSEAGEKYQQAIRVKPDEARAYAGLGHALSQQKQYAEAIEQFLKAAEIDPTSISYPQWVSALQALPQSEQEATADKFQRIVDGKPEPAKAWLKWADALARKKSYAEAGETYQQAIRVNPDEAKAYAGLGKALCRQRQYAEAIEQLLKAAAIDPTSMDYKEWASAFQALPESAQKSTADKFQRIVDSKPEAGKAWLKWANALASQERYAEAGEKYQQAIRVKPDEARAYTGLGEALRQQEQYAGAIEQFLKAAEIDPTLIDYDEWVSALQALPESAQKATADKFQRIVEGNPEPADAWLAWADALDEQKRYAEAGKKYQQAISVRPGEARAYAGLSKALSNQGQYAEAIEHFLKTAELDLTSLDYDELCGALDHLAKDEQRKQIEKFQELVEDKPEALTFYCSLGDSLYSRKKYADAGDKYRKATELNPESARAFLGWGNALRDSKQYNEGDAKYEKVLQLDPDNEDGQAAQACGLWGDALASRTRYAEAIEEYKKALDLDEEYAGVYAPWANALSSLKRFADAGEQSEKAAAANPSDPNVYLGWGWALLALHRDSEAQEKYESAIKIDAEGMNVADRYFYWGNGLASRNRIAEALEKYREAVRMDPGHAFSHHNIASYLQGQGNYRAAWSEWERAELAYENGLQKAQDEKDADYFRYFASVLAKLEKLDDADKNYRKGLELDPNHLDILTDLVDLYLGQRSDLLKDGKPDREGRTEAHCKAREAYRKAEGLLKDQFAAAEDASIFIQWGQLYLSMEEYDQAEKQLLKALTKDNESGGAYNKLGVVKMRQEEFQKAIEYFRNALHRDPDDLQVRSNLAEAFLKAGFPDKAEVEYKAVLNVSANHVESEIGLGYVYTAMAEARHDEDLYEEATQHFSRAIQIGTTKPASASKKLKPKELAELYYASGYARVQRHGSSKLLRDKWVSDALKDFDKCCDLDKEHHKADRARKKIREKLSPVSADQLLDKVGQGTILFMSGFVFLLTQVSFLEEGKFSALGYYVPVTFGSIILMIAGFYLPRLLKLKVAGIELEKSSVDQATSSGSIEISK